MCYTSEQKAVICGVIGSQFMGRNLSDRLRERFNTAFVHLQTDKLDAGDLRIIENALELITPQNCQTCSKEGYRDLISALMTTRLMLREA